jgi:hypothetical protein
MGEPLVTLGVHFFFSILAYEPLPIGFEVYIDLQMKSKVFKACVEGSYRKVKIMVNALLLNL